jgi:F-type H+-transporting ATPase subunit c
MTRKTLLFLATFFGVMTVGTVAFAADGADTMHTVAAWTAIAQALAIGIAAFGGALGQGKAAAAALDGIARNPSASGRIFTPFILGLALIESLVIYAFVIAILMNLKWGSVVDSLMAAG